MGSYKYQLLILKKNSQRIHMEFTYLVNYQEFTKNSQY